MWSHSAQHALLATILLSRATIAVPYLPSGSSEPAAASLSSVGAASTATPSSNGTIGPVTSQDGQFLRGVNLGGWLVLEKWMNAGLFTGAFGGNQIKDQYTFDGVSGASKALMKHWDTFFTVDDIKTISETGINALRIPIGFWAYDNDGLPYQKGADSYLEKAIEWARQYKMKVWVDLHGSPGSQNGFDNSGQSGAHKWQQGNNLQRSINVLKVMAAKYGSENYADVVVGLELVNEPTPDSGNNFGKTQQWAQDATAAVRAAAANKKLMVIMHDSFRGPQSWESIGENLNAGGENLFGIDTHLYQVFSNEDKALNQAGHIKKACSWANNLGPTNAKVPVFVGEWSAASDVCIDDNKQDTAGSSCSGPNCQCESSDMSSWNDDLVSQARRYVEAQLDTFEKNSHGYFIWAAKGPGPWGFMDAVKKGVFPNPVTDRKYPGQCNSQ